jgi:hypothetical protein
MADAEVSYADSAATPQQFAADMSAVAARASALAQDVRTCPPPPFSDDAGSMLIEVEVRGLDERVTVPAPADPGSVRGAVEKALRRFGLPAVEL